MCEMRSRYSISELCGINPPFGRNAVCGFGVRCAGRGLHRKCDSLGGGRGVFVCLCTGLCTSLVEGTAVCDEYVHLVDEIVTALVALGCSVVLHEVDQLAECCDTLVAKVLVVCFFADAAFFGADLVRFGEFALRFLQCVECELEVATSNQLSISFLLENVLNVGDDRFDDAGKALLVDGTSVVVDFYVFPKFLCEGGTLRVQGVPVDLDEPTEIAECDGALGVQLRCVLLCCGLRNAGCVVGEITDGNLVCIQLAANVFEVDRFGSRCHIVVESDEAFVCDAVEVDCFYVCHIGTLVKSVDV